MKKGDVQVTVLLPDLIRAYLKEKGMTQKDFADACDIDPASLSRMLRSNPLSVDVRTLQKIEQAKRDGLIELDIDYGDLFEVKS